MRTKSVAARHGERKGREKEKRNAEQRSRPNKYRVPGRCRGRAHFKYFNYFSYKPRSSSLADAFDPKPLVSVTSPLFDLSLSLFSFDGRPPNVVRLSSVIGSGRVQQTFVMGRIDTMASDKSLVLDIQVYKNWSLCVCVLRVVSLFGWENMFNRHTLDRFGWFARFTRGNSRNRIWMRFGPRCWIHVRTAVLQF